MSATIAGAMKAHLESLGLALTVYRDGAPAQEVTDENGRTVTRPAPWVPYPHAVVQESIARTPVPMGDESDPDGDRVLIELVQVDLYELARTVDGTAAATRTVERYELAPAMDEALAVCARGLAAHAPYAIHGARVQQAQRWPVSDNLVRHTWTVRINRSSRRLTP